MNNWFKTTFLLAGLTALFLFIGAAFGGQQGLIMALGIALIMNLGAYWFSDKLVLSIYKAEPIHVRHHFSGLYDMVQTLAKRAYLPMPKVYVIHDKTPNAFATGRNPEHAAVAVTTGLIDLLTPEELNGVIAHELAHIKHRDTLISTIAATLAGAIGMLGSWLQWAVILGGHRQNDRRGNGFAGIALAILAPIAATLIQMAISRSREFAADRQGAEICGHPLWLASALQKLETASKRNVFISAENHPETAHLFIVNPLNGKTLASLFSTHPATQERIQKLRALAQA